MAAAVRPSGKSDGLWVYFLLTYLISWMCWGALIILRIPGGSVRPDAPPPPPVGLILLFVILVAPRIIAGHPVKLAVIGLMAAGYYLLYTFMGQLADIVPCFTLSFLVSVAVLTGVVALLRLRDDSSRLMSWQDTAAFFAFALLYPLAIIDSDRTDFWMQVFYVAILLYTCVLVVRFRVVPALKGNGAPSHD